METLVSMRYVPPGVRNMRKGKVIKSRVAKPRICCFVCHGMLTTSQNSLFKSLIIFLYE